MDSLGIFRQKLQQSLLLELIVAQQEHRFSLFQPVIDHAAQDGNLTVEGRMFLESEIYAVLRGSKCEFDDVPFRLYILLN